MTVLCDYCGNPAELVGGDVIYPHRPDLATKRFWRCVPCYAYVGCHGNTTQPLGRLANAELRTLKMMAHEAFDPLWKKRAGRFRRRDAYRQLAKFLGITPSQCHIGMFDADTCKRVIEFAVEQRLA